MTSIAWFITPHGFGHATRSLAMMAAIRCRRPEVRFEIFSKIPDQLIVQSLPDGYRVHQCECDVGFAQKNALEVDYPESLRRLGAFMPFSDETLGRLSRQLHAVDCQLVVCDISVLGIAAAERAGIPSVLVENFTWDWIYQPYLKLEAGLAPYIHQFREWYERANHHIQTTPVSVSVEGAFTCQPVAREMRQSREVIRAELGVEDRRPIVMITMGGVGLQLNFLEHLTEVDSCCFLIPGLEQSPSDNVIALADFSKFYHPDLIAAADVVIGKLGYSTVAEVFHGGTTFGFVGRRIFPESAILGQFVLDQQAGFEIREDDFLDGRWLKHLPQLLSLPRRPKPTVNGADETASFLLDLIT